MAASANGTSSQAIRKMRVSAKRPFTVSGDELNYTTAAASGDGSSKLVWKRIK